MKISTLLILLWIGQICFAQNSGIISGNVFLNDSSIAGVNTNVVLSYSYGSHMASIKADSTGYFEFKDLLPGSYDIEFNHYGFSNHLIVFVDVNTNQSTEVLIVLWKCYMEKELGWLVPDLNCNDKIEREKEVGVVDQK